MTWKFEILGFMNPWVERVNRINPKLVWVILFLGHFSSFANLRLPQLVSDHMVLQRDIKLKIWGWGDPGEKVKITFRGRNVSVRTGANGKWLAFLSPLPWGGPYTMIIEGNNSIQLKDILIGDVWFCSGQSNMVLPMERLKEKYSMEVSQDHFSEIRNFFVPTKADVTQLHEDLPPGTWKPAVGQGLLEFGGTTYFFAKQLYQKYHIPIGIINSSVGGVPIEAWMSEDAFQNFPEDLAQIKNFKDSSYMNRANRRSTRALSANIPMTTSDQDKGILGPVKWTDTAYIPLNWHRFWMPGYWVDQGVKALNGVLYFRKEVEIPESMTGVPGKLFLGRIIDADSTFVNGKFIGNITYQYPPRRYEVPSGLLKPGKNIIVVKIMSMSGKGGFVPDKNYSLIAGGHRIDLRGDWIYQVGKVQDRFRPNLLVGNIQNEPKPIIAQNAPTGLFNTMAAPAIQYGIKGFIWYQGESNSGKPKEYAKLLPALMSDWRNKWQEGNIPFLYVQLPNFMEVNYLPEESDWAQLRQSQLEALSIPNSGMAVGIDCGEWNDIHPLDKKDIGDRLALWADHFSNGPKDLVYSGPIFKSFKIEGNKVILSFNLFGGGLMVKGGGELNYFSIAGADHKFVWAKAKIKGNQVEVWNDHLSNPLHVRYAWADNPEGANLFNAEGLPASPFETQNP